MTSFLSDPNMMRYMGQMGLGLLAAGQPQPPGVNRYHGLMSSFNQANQGLLQSRLMDMKMEEYEEKKKDRMSQKSALSTLFGGPDPSTGITWDQGRAGMSDDERLGLVGQVAPEAAMSQMYAKERPNRYTLGPGQTRFEGGEEVASVPDAPTEAKNVSAITLRNTNTQETISLDRRDPRLGKFLGPNSPWVEETRQVTGKLPASKRDEITGEIDALTRATSRLDKMVASIGENRSRAGVPGTLKQWGQEALGIATDLSSIGIDVPGTIGDTMTDLEGDLNEGMADPSLTEYFDESLPRTEVFENSLAYALARARKGAGRLNKDDLENAKRDTKVRGLRSADSVMAKLGAVREEIQEALKDLKARRGQETGGELPTYGLVDGKFQILEE
jgi:hypothetical protein